MSTHTNTQDELLHGGMVDGSGRGAPVLYGGDALVVGAPVVVEVVDVLTQSPVGHCQTPFASAVQMHFPPQPLGPIVVVLPVPDALSPTGGRSLVQWPSLCLYTCTRSL